MPAKKENGALPTERSSSVDGKKPCVPMIPLPSPNASAKPTAQYTSEQIPKISTFLPAMCAAFFIRVRPASRNAKPACMNITSTAVTITQIVLAAMRRSWFLGTDLDLLQALARPVVGDVADAGRPDEPVAALVAAARRVDDRVDDGMREVVLDDERQQRLRQEPRLEDAPPVLVRDPALPAVSDRLDDRDADVA